MSNPSSLHNDHSSLRFISRHKTLLAVLLVLGVTMGALTIGQSWNASSAKRRSDRLSGEKGPLAGAALKRGFATGNANSATAAAMFLAQFTQQGSKLTGSGATGNANQGNSVSLSSDGNTAIIGGPSDNSSAGAAWVFTRSGEVWTQETKLAGSGATGNANQGYSVSLSSDGNTAIIGGPSDNSSAGAAWVFTRSGGVWTQETKLTGSGATGNAGQGISVSLSSDGNTAIIGGYTDNGGAGAAWVFTRSGGVWTQETKLAGSGATGNANQGISVSLSSDGNTAIIGGYTDNGGAGAAWVFTRSGGVWTQETKLAGSGATGNASQGVSVSLSSDGNTAIIGGNTDNSNAGAAWVFTRSGGVWTQEAKLAGSDAIGNAQQGISVSLSGDGNTAIIGGRADNSGAGAAWIFTRSGGVWTQETKLAGSDATGDAQQGISVSLSSDGTTAIIGGYADNSSAGAAWVFTRPSNTPPTITAAGPLTRQQGETANSTIATVADTESGAGGVTVTATTVPTGISVTSIVNSAGTVTADVKAECTAAIGDKTVVLTATDGDGATNTANLTVSVTATSPPPITPTPAEVCANSSGNTASGPAGMTAYAWGITNGTITSATNTQSITYTAGASGTVTLSLTVTDANGCTPANSAPVTINPNPPTPPITPTPAQVCANSTGNSAAGPAGATTYAWSIVNGTITSATNIQTIIYTAGASGTVDLTLVVTNASGCSASNTANVTINANPTTPPITPTPAQVCANSTGNSAAGPAGATTYAWSIVNGTITSATNIQTITYTAGASGTVDLTLVVTNASGCSASNTVNVTVAALPPTPTITPSGSVTFCDSGMLTSSSASGNQWYKDNVLLPGQTNSTYDATASGSYTVTVTNGNGCTSAPSAATTVTVQPTAITVTNANDSGTGSLRQAILDACASGATINFDPALTSGGPATITLTSGELLIDKVITINGPTNNGLTISGNNTNILNTASRIFNINSGKSLTFSFLTIANGKSAQGGGIFNAGTLTTTNSTLTGNVTANGTDVNSSSAGGNSTDGGAIYNTGTLTLINSTISGNQTGRGGNNSGTGNGGNSGNGGGIYSTGTLKLTNSTVANNKTGAPGQPNPNPDPNNPNPGTIGTAGLGGGIFQSGGTLTLNNTIVATNVNGFLDPDDINGTATSSTFNLIGSNAGLSGISDGSNGNQVGTAAIPLSPDLGALANNGGPTQTQLPDQFSTAIDAGSNALAVDQNNVALTTDQRGAGFLRKIDGGKGKPDEPTVDIGAVEAPASTASPGADLTVTKSVDRDTVVPDRDLTYTIVVTNNGADAATSVSLTDNLPQVANNSDPNNPTYTSTTFVSFSSPAGWSCSTPSVGSGGTVSCTKASFAGVSQQTFTLVVHVPPSAVANSGDPFISNSVSVDAANDTNTENNSGFAVTQLSSCFTNPIVTKNTDNGPGTLRQSIADACAGATITFDTTQFTSPITLTSAELLINKNLTINGPGANLLTVKRSTAGGTPSFRIFNVASGTVNISGLTISNGNGGAGFGGGILYGSSSTLSVTNSTISGNSAVGGAGISNSSSGTLNLINSTVSGNTGGNLGGGGIFSGSGVLNVTNSTISGNSSSDGGGAGINSGGTATIANSTISNNPVSGGTGGGGIRNSGTVNLRNSIVAGNTAATGAPDFSGTLNSQDYNLIGNTTGATITGTTTHNIINQSANLGALANYGGPTQTMLPLQNSPAINAGDSGANLPPDTFDLDGDSNTSEALPVDQRGFARVVGGNFDIGAVETNYAVVATAGSGQNTNVNSAFATALKVTVTESGVAQNSVSVTFTAPGSGASGTFPGSSLTANVSTNSSGQATTPTFTANAIGGSYNVIASIGVNTPTASFALTNNKLNQTITFASISGKTFGDADFSVSPTASSSLAVSLAASGNCTVTTPAPGTVHITGAGNCTITASQTGNGTFSAATDVQQSFTIAKAATSTAVSATPNPSNSSQSVTFTATVTSGAGTPTGTVQFKDGGTNLGSPQTLNGSGVATFSTSALTPGVHTITADYSGDSNFATSTGTLSGGQQVGSIIRFSSSSYNTTENSGSTTITVQRVGDLSQAVTVDYATPDDSSATTVLPCSTANGVASPRCDFEPAFGTIRFAAGDGAAKTFIVLINQDNLVEGPETLTLTLSNLTGAGVSFPTPGASTTTATLTIADDVTEPATNPIDDTDTFVRQHYRDFLNREPDPSGLAFWKDNIDKCNDSARRPAGLTVAQCFEVQHINTSAAFFLSIEFQNTGYFVERVYKAGFGDISPPTVPVPVRFTNFITDTQQIGNGVIVGVGSWQTQLDNNKTAYTQAFVQRPAFLSRYPTSTSATAFVDALNANAGSVLSDSDRAALISELSPNPADPVLRADVLKKVADNATLQQREFNRAFVLLEYFGYLRRNPDAAPEPALNFAGYNFWLNKLNQFGGNYIDAEMVKAFLSSAEYRHRFGP